MVSQIVVVSQRRIFEAYRADIYLFKVNHSNTRTMCEVCSKSTLKKPERRHYGVIVVNFEQIFHIVLIFLFLTLNK